jgi:hypothetical protein
MTRSQLWKIYTDRNPSFAGDGNVTMTARGPRKMFETTWESLISTEKLSRMDHIVGINKMIRLRR